MQIASTIQQVREAKSENAVKVDAANNASNNGANTNANNHAVDQSKVVKTDTVDLSKKSVELATTTEKSEEETTKQVTAREKSQDARTNYREAMMKSQNELRSVVKDLKDAGVGRHEIGSIIRTANREANKTIGTEMRQTYNDYRGKKINRSEFTTKLYGSAVKKLDGIVSALKDALAQKVVPADKNTEAVKENANATKSHEATNATKETRVTDADDASKANAEENTEKTKEAVKETVAKADDDDGDKKAAKEEKKAATTTTTTTTTTTSGLIVKKEKVVAPAGVGVGVKIVHGDGSADKAFAQIIDFFNDIDKMVNGFADEELEVKGSNGEDKGESLVKFASKLNDMFSSINKAFGRHEGDNVGNRLGMAQVQKETISQLFDSGHGSGAINRIGDAGEGSGNFNAVSFMSSMSNGINDALESYKDVQKAAEKQEAKEESKEVVGAVA